MKMYANLHTHTTHSDGVYSPEEMVKVAKNEGYGAIAISDHDTATAYPYLKEACEKEGMECIFAVEFSVFEPDWYHIIGFDFDPEYTEMKDYLTKMSENTVYTTKSCFDEAVELGNITGITWEEILEFNKGVTWLCNNHIFRAMKAKGMVEENQYMDWFNLNFREQRGKYKGRHKFKTLPEIVKLIKDAGGIAVVAHPTDEQLSRIDYLIENGIEGLEVWHPEVEGKTRQKAFSLAIKHNLFISGGSDHSGLCGGFYDSYKDEESLKESKHYIKPMSAGTTKQFFEELKQRKLSDNRCTELKIYANLHTHSTHSDGVYTPEELVKVAKAEGYGALAITDHDTATAYPELKAACEKEGIECIFGVEFSVQLPEWHHIVGFHFDPEYPPMKEYLAELSQDAHNKTKGCFDEAVELGDIKGITWEEVLEYNKGVSWFASNHVHRAMKAKGLMGDEGYLDWHRHNFPLERRHKYSNPSVFRPLAEVVKLIKDAGGIAVVAHPREEQLDMIDYLIENGIEGIELCRGAHAEKRQRILDLALEKNLFISGGTDHSGLCGGLYSSFGSEEELMQSVKYIEPLTAGTTKEYFEEIKQRKLIR